MGYVATGVDSLGFDTASKITKDRAKAAFDAGFRFVVRYVGFGTSLAPGDIENQEMKIILDAGLAMMLVQHAHNPGWYPLKGQGTQDGKAAAKLAWHTGYLDGAHIWLDAEGMSANTTPQQAIDYIEEWCAAVKDHFEPGIYVGYGVPLTPTQLWNLSVNRYWSDFGPRAVDRRSFCMKQLLGNVPAFGTRIDPDWMHADLLGGFPKWMTKS